MQNLQISMGKTRNPKGWFAAWDILEVNTKHVYFSLSIQIQMSKAGGRDPDRVAIELANCQWKQQYNARRCYVYVH